VSVSVADHSKSLLFPYSVLTDR